MAILNSQNKIWLSILAMATIIRLCIAANHPLFESECYYWLWSQHLDFGYFDHPPMISYFIYGSDFLGAPHSLAARLHAPLAHFAISLLLYCFARNLFSDNSIAIRTAIIYNLLPIFSIFAIQNQPDVPLLLFWCITLVCFERAIHTPKRWWWFVSGLAGGGMLLSKFHGFCLLGCLFLYLLWSNHRYYLKTPWPYIACAIALLCYTPNVYWNWQHQWITYDYQLLRHATRGSDFSLEHVLVTLFLPFLTLSPWVYVMFCYISWNCLRKGFLQGQNAKNLCLWASIPLFIFFIAVSFNKRVKPHWPAPAFVAMCPLLAIWLETWSRKWRIKLYLSAAALTIFVYIYVLSPVPMFIAFSEEFPHSHGWQEFGAYLQKELSINQEPLYIMARRYDWAATLAFYTRQPKLVHVMDVGYYKETSRISDPRGFLLWPKPINQGDSAIYILSRRRKLHKLELHFLRRWFDRLEKVREFSAEVDGVVIKRWRYLHCHGFKGSQ